jgi:hypothetical protein
MLIGLPIFMAPKDFPLFQNFIKVICERRLCQVQYSILYYFKSTSYIPKKDLFFLNSY